MQSFIKKNEIAKGKSQNYFNIHNKKKKEAYD